MTRRFYNNWDEEKYRRYLELFHIDESKRVDQLSSGMKVKYMIALALRHNARLLILDEPTSGLDPVSRDELTELLRRRELLIEKRTKRKQLAEVDIAPMIRDISFTQGENVLRAAVTVQAQNPGLNPQLIEKAIAAYLPELTPDFVRVRRRAILDANGQDFR